MRGLIQRIRSRNYGESRVERPGLDFRSCRPYRPAARSLDPVQVSRDEIAPRLTQRRSAAASPSRVSRCRGSCSRSEEHTSELQSLMRISYAVFCLTKKNNTSHEQITHHNLSTQTT